MTDGCGCIYSALSGLEPEFLTERWPKARKAHPCVECGEPVAIGEAYERVSAMYDGGFRTYATCGFCARLRTAFYCEEWVYGNLWSDIEESLFPHFNQACLAKLDTPADKQRLQRCWWKWVDQQN